MTTTEIAVKMILDRWYASIKNCEELLSSLPDEVLMKEIAPGKNRGMYLLGHLIAAHDDMMVLMDLGEKLYPELNEPYLKNSDKQFAAVPSLGQLRQFWARQCEIMHAKFEAMPTSNWFEKHTAVSSDDFEKEPHRNKLNIVVTRTSHLQYHLGQLRLLK